MLSYGQPNNNPISSAKQASCESVKLPLLTDTGYCICIRKRAPCCLPLIVQVSESRSSLLLSEQHLCHLIGVLLYFISAVKLTEVFELATI